MRALDSEADAQYERLQRALATKRELQRKLAAAQSLAALWAAHRDSVAQLAAAQQASGVQSALDGSQQLTSTLRQGWQILEATDGASAAAVPPTAAGPRGLQQRFLQRRAEISTVRGVREHTRRAALLPDVSVSVSGAPARPLASCPPGSYAPCRRGSPPIPPRPQIAPCLPPRCRARR